MKPFVTLVTPSGAEANQSAENDPSGPEAEVSLQASLQPSLIERGTALANLGAAYAAVLGQDVMPRDILDTILASDGDSERPQIEVLAEACGRPAGGVQKHAAALVHRARRSASLP